MRDMRDLEDPDRSGSNMRDLERLEMTVQVPAAENLTRLLLCTCQQLVQDC